MTRYMCQVGSTRLESVHTLSKHQTVENGQVPLHNRPCFFPSAAEVPATCFGVARTPMVQALSCILTRSKANEQCIDCGISSQTQPSYCASASHIHPPHLWPPCPSSKSWRIDEWKCLTQQRKDMKQACQCQKMHWASSPSSHLLSGMRAESNSYKYRGASEL